MTEVERPLLVFFWSERSGPARRMESLLAHFERKERQRLRIRRIDVDANPELAERFRVDVVPTLILIKDKPCPGWTDVRAHRGSKRCSSRTCRASSRSPKTGPTSRA